MRKSGLQSFDVALGVECAWPADCVTAAVAPPAAAQVQRGKQWRRLAAAVFASALLVSLIAMVAGTTDIGAVFPAGFPVLGN
ncbi:MAG TPA: hypothetical protein PLX20_07705 [Rhodocyclaceae bacterium]|nr:hypothetical protein [Rhodocyclaceae bacterium]HMV53095.1 hypothetical protein [Rhodocyclaceae bacterium]HMZ84798.1 hypothetical protein [Rhodocyclaceae bacterium]HNA04636.1 hypothetical protein [Rhodocyclaceae bacterium]HNB80114.1 hypothetical protein [Rhodocyclaceae bacterium]